MKRWVWAFNSRYPRVYSGWETVCPDSMFLGFEAEVDLGDGWEMRGRAGLGFTTAQPRVGNTNGTALIWKVRCANNHSVPTGVL